MPDYGFGALAIGSGAQAGLQQLIRQRLLERQMALQEQAQRENSDYRNRSLDADIEASAAQREFNNKIALDNQAERNQAGLERFAAKDVASTAVGSSLSPERADVWSQGGQGGVVRNAVTGTVSDPDAGGERPAQMLFRGYTAPEAERVNAAAQATEDRRIAADEAAKDREGLLRLSKSLAGSGGGGVGGGSALTPGGLDVAATQYAQTGQMPPLGMGSSSMRAAIINRAAELFPGVNIGSEAGKYRANTASLSQMTKRYNAVQAYANQAKMSLENAARLSSGVARSGVPLTNRYRNWVNKNITGSAPLSEFEVFVYTAARDYARVTSGGAESVAQMTDAATEAADALLNSAQSPAQFAAALRSMQTDMDNVTQMLGDQIAQIGQDVGRVPGQAPAQAAPAPTADIEWVRDPKTGKLVKKGG